MTSFFHRIADVYLFVYLFINLKQYLVRGAKLVQRGWFEWIPDENKTKQKTTTTTQKTITDKKWNN